MKIYNKDHCWQYEMRLNTLDEDMDRLGYTQEYLDSLRVTDFDYRLATKDDYGTAQDFILKYEWLGTMPPYPTHIFLAYHKDILAGVLIYTMPNAFSKLVGEETKDLERLLARGACASWTPKNLATHFIAWSIDYMVENTQYRVFTAYSDPLAKELGTIYQAGNWIYLGQSSGAPKKYQEPNSDKWVSDRKFRNLASFKKYAREMGIEWQPNWSTNRTVHWENMPEGLEEKLRYEGKRRLAECKVKKVPAKHKYAYIKGKDKRETRKLMKLLKESTNIKGLYDYPLDVERGRWK